MQSPLFPLVPNSPSDFKWRFNETGGVTITRFLKTDAFYAVVPAKIAGRPVTKINSPTFRYCRALKLLAFVGDAPTFEEEAFVYCDALRFVASSDGQVEIPDVDARRLTFNELRAQTLDGVLFSADGKTIYALLEPKLKYVVPDGVVAIGEYAFYHSKTLRAITFAASVCEIGEYAFANGALRSVAFKENESTSDDETTVPQEKTIGDYAFHQCDALRSIAFPQGTKRIGRSAFSFCETLESLAFPRELSEIARDAFFSCSALKTVEFPKGLETIGETAFYRCAELETLAFPKGLKTIDRLAFYGCVALRSIAFDGSTEVGEYAFGRCYALHLATFAAETPTFDDETFDESYALRFVASPDGQAEIPGVACRRLTLDELRAQTVDGILFSADGKTLLTCVDAKTEYVVPPRVEKIGKKAFFGRRTLRSITFPEGLKTVEEDAFYHCFALHSVALPAGLETLGHCAFGDAEPNRLGPNFTIYGVRGSVAEREAEANGFRFIPR